MGEAGHGLFKGVQFGEKFLDGFDNWCDEADVVEGQRAVRR